MLLVGSRYQEGSQISTETNGIRGERSFAVQHPYGSERIGMVGKKLVRKKKSGMELDLEDEKADRVAEWSGSVEELLDAILKR